MRLFAAIVPTVDALLEVNRLVESTTPDSQTEDEPKRLFRRKGVARGAHAAGRPPKVVGPNRQLDVVPPHLMCIPITGFGNVAQSDADRLAAALRSEARTWDVPVVRFTGGKALEFPGDQSVWVAMDGEVDALRLVARGVPTLVQRLGFFVDRRVFRPWMALGTITDETTAPYLEKLVAALDGFEGRSWAVEHVSLMRRPPDAPSSAEFEEVERMPLRGV